MREWPRAGIRGEEKGQRSISFLFYTFKQIPHKVHFFHKLAKLSDCNAKWFRGIINKYRQNRQSGAEERSLFTRPLWRPETDPLNK